MAGIRTGVPEADVCSYPTVRYGLDASGCRWTRWLGGGSRYRFRVMEKVEDRRDRIEVDDDEMMMQLRLGTLDAEWMRDPWGVGFQKMYFHLL